MRIRQTSCILASFTAVHAQEVGWTANGRDVAGHPLSSRIRDHARERRAARGRLDVPHRRNRSALRDAQAGCVRGDAARRRRHDVSSARRSAASSRSTPRPGGSAGSSTRRSRATSRYGDFASRGVSTWLDRRAPRRTRACRAPHLRRHRRQSQLFALDARDGTPLRGVRRAAASVDLEDGLRIAPFEPQAYSMTSPPVVVNGVRRHRLVDRRQQPPDTAERRGARRSTRAPARCAGPGIRFRRTRAIRRTATWRGRDGAQDRRARTRGRCSRPIPSAISCSCRPAAPRPDYYGGLRLGDNRYANSIVALRASTGQRGRGRSRPCTTTSGTTTTRRRRRSSPITRDGTRVPAVLQATKTGMLFVLDRETGRPIFPVEERAVPASDIPGEEASPTQPFTTRDAAAQPASIHASTTCGAPTTPIARRAAPPIAGAAQRGDLHAAEPARARS